MRQIIKVQQPVSSAPINGLYHRPLLAAAFTIALLGVLLYKNWQSRDKGNIGHKTQDEDEK